MVLEKSHCLSVGGIVHVFYNNVKLLHMLHLGSAPMHLSLSIYILTNTCYTKRERAISYKHTGKCQYPSFGRRNSPVWDFICLCNVTESTQCCQHEANDRQEATLRGSCAVPVQLARDVDTEALQV